MTALDLTANGKAASRGEALAHWTRTVSVLFFLSGFPALIYQLTWQRSLFRIFGVNIESVTIVVTAFMLGLGLGSLLGGSLPRRTRPHQGQRAGHRRQHGQRVALLARAGI